LGTRKGVQMNEVFPVVAGIVSGLFMFSAIPTRLRTVMLIACSVIFGAVAAWISGELLVSWTFLAIDIALVLLTASATFLVLAVWYQRHSRQSY